MAIKTVRRTSVFNRLGEAGHLNLKVCTFYQQGRCNRSPCNFAHIGPVFPRTNQSPASYKDRQSKYTWRNPESCISKRFLNSLSQEIHQKISSNERHGFADSLSQEIHQKIGSDESLESTDSLSQEIKCSVPLAEGDEIINSNNSEDSHKKKRINITDGCKDNLSQEIKPSVQLVKASVSDAKSSKRKDNFPDLHSLSSGGVFSFLSKLEGHNKAVTGIALPSGSDKLYSGDCDKSLWAWDCHTGQCAGTAKLEGEIGTLSSDGPWIFVGLTNAVKAFNTYSKTEFNLSGPNGIVRSLISVDDMLFAGDNDGNILGWKFTSETSDPKLLASVSGHKGSVLATFVGRGKRLYSGSTDNTVKVWNRQTFECLQTLEGHSDHVTSVICYDCYLLSGSLDGTIKVWETSKKGDIEEICSHTIGHGVLMLRGMVDAEGKPILFASCNDNVVRLFDLPTFIERERIFSEEEIQTIEIDDSNKLLFIGDTVGQVSIWKLVREQATSI